MKIVLCCHKFLPQFTGGVEIYTLRLARTLKEFGHDVYIVTGELVTKGNLSVEVHWGDYENIPTIRLVYDYDCRPVTHRASYSDPIITEQIYSILGELNPDIIHATSLSLLMAGTIEAAVRLGIPIVHTAMDRVLVCRRGFHLKHDDSICTSKEEINLCTACMGPRNQLETWLDTLWKRTPKPLREFSLPLAEKVIGKKADFVHAAESIRYRLNYLPRWRPKIDRIIAPSSHTRDMFILNDFPENRIVVSPYGVEEPDTVFVKEPADHLRFGFIGRVTFLKGVHILLEAFASLAETPARLKIYGDADEKSIHYMRKLQNKAAPLLNVEFAGHIANNKISDAYREMDILIFPSISPENSPITVLEAQAHRVPVISSNIAGVSDVIHHEHNGLLFRNQDSQDLARQIQRCITSPELVGMLAQNSQLIKSIRQEAGEILELYEAVVESKAV